MDVLAGREGITYSGTTAIKTTEVYNKTWRAITLGNEHGRPEPGGGLVPADQLGSRVDAHPDGGHCRKAF